MREEIGVVLDKKLGKFPTLMNKNGNEAVVMKAYLMLKLIYQQEIQEVHFLELGGKRYGII